MGNACAVSSGRSYVCTEFIFRIVECRYDGQNHVVKKPESISCKSLDSRGYPQSNS